MSYFEELLCFFFTAATTFTFPLTVHKDSNFSIVSPTLVIFFLFCLLIDPTSPSQGISVLGVHWKDWCWSLSSNSSATWCLKPAHWKKTDAGRDWGQEEKGTTEDEMAGWHDGLDGRESEWPPGVGDGQGGLGCCDSWGCKGSDTTERLNWTELNTDSDN